MPAIDPHQALFGAAQRVLPGGVSASARFNPAIGRPFFVSRGEGPYIFDLAGRRYIDMCLSHGASLLGHAHPKITAAVRRALDLGLICSYETKYHTALAQRVTELVPCAEMVRFSGSGTETVMHALRLARAVTRREKVIKFEGHFHGYSDDLFFSSAPPLDQAGPAATPIPYAQSAGIPHSARKRIVVVPFNDPAALEAAFAQHGAQAATLILEPINYDS
ncbi:MAG: aminotransferase class III-fold pyridoxal phosphate-dependent enzyme, partial [Anaerolineales bacterium]